ncbi:hypothetical protein ACIPPQ_20015 [Sphingopyxis sp. LARHCG72]
MTPLERAARAVYKLDDNGPYTLAEEDEQWHHHVETVRAVLTAIREPFQSFDDPIAVAGGEVLGVGKDRPLHWSNFDEAKRVWQAMIDAALAEGEDEH